MVEAFSVTHSGLAERDASLPAPSLSSRMLLSNSLSVRGRTSEGVPEP